MSSVVDHPCFSKIKTKLCKNKHSSKWHFFAKFDSLEDIEMWKINGQ